MALLSDELRLRLLTAIENKSLLFLCGAGLSIPVPSSLLSAESVAQQCYDRRSAIEALPNNLRNDIDALAGFFYARGDFTSVFIQLVPWNELLGQPNEGHAAVADFLAIRAAHAALSSNFDPLIEMWAQQRKVDLRPALTGQQAAAATAYSPLLKIHGCMQTNRNETLWTHGQLTEAAVQARIGGISQWINLHAPGKDLVVVGFWSDWGYLNDVLTGAFAINNASSVTVIDPSPIADLQAKAPKLWDCLHVASGAVEHVQQSSADVLEELRAEYSKVWVRRFFALGEPSARAAGIVAPAAATPDALECEELYQFRQDAEGKPYIWAATQSVPPANAGHTAFVHLLLFTKGATQEGAWLKYGGLTIRVVNGAGRDLSEVRALYKEPTTAPQPNLVICAGAEDFGVPSRIIAGGRGASTVRPAAGGSSRWLTLDQARAELTV